MKEANAVQEGFRDAMSRLAAGVVMVTCHIDGKPWGLTVSACCSVSMEPPLLLVSLGTATASTHAIAESGYFGVSILGETLVDVARFGSVRGHPKYMDEYCRKEHCPSRSPVVADSLAHVDCSVEYRVPAGDHVLYIGRVQSVMLTEQERPLVYFSRSFHRLGESTDLHVRPEVDETIDSLLYDYPLPRRFQRGAALVP